MEMKLAQSQQYSMSQHMIQSVEILQMNTWELNQYAEKVSIENPVLEHEDNADESSSAIILQEKLKWLRSFDKKSTGSYELSVVDEDDSDISVYSNKNCDSLYDYLNHQIMEFSLTDREKKILRYLIWNLDENGYLSISKEQLYKDLPYMINDIKHAMEVLQQMDPPGLGAQDLKECLLLQLKRKKLNNPMLINIVEKHLEKLAHNQLHKVAKELNISLEEVKIACKELSRLNPKPGNGFTTNSDSQYVLPDIFVIDSEDSYEILLNDHEQSQLKINSFYLNLVSELKNKDDQTIMYIRDKFKQAQWIIKCIEQRKSTLLRCANVIVDKQFDFFKKGPGNIVSMSLLDVSQEVGIHISTVSRTIKGKYLQCRWGVFPLSLFFQRLVNNINGEHTQETVSIVIKEIIENENKKNPLSDANISQMLINHGIRISRRTVAKYRDNLKIPAASCRKKY